MSSCFNNHPDRLPFASKSREKFVLKLNLFTLNCRPFADPLGLSSDNPQAKNQNQNFYFKQKYLCETVSVAF